MAYEKIMTAKEYVDKCIELTEHKTIYVLGGFNAPVKEGNIEKYFNTKVYSFNCSDARRAAIGKAVEEGGYYGADCVCFQKAIWWGFNYNYSHRFGGAVYESNGIGDMAIDTILSKCEDVTSDFDHILPGEFLYYDAGHCGMYIGDGRAVECTPIWRDGVQITKVSNITHTQGFQSRKWAYHGKLPWIDYSEPAPEEVEPEEVEAPSEEIPEIDENTDSGIEELEPPTPIKQDSLIKRIIRAIANFLLTIIGEGAKK